MRTASKNIKFWLFNPHRAMRIFLRDFCSLLKFVCYSCVYDKDIFWIYRNCGTHKCRQKHPDESNHGAQGFNCFAQGSNHANEPACHKNGRCAAIDFCGHTGHISPQSSPGSGYGWCGDGCDYRCGCDIVDN